jgi:hypothetical protein
MAWSEHMKAMLVQMSEAAQDDIEVSFRIAGKSSRKGLTR